MAQSSNITFVCCIESGFLESQTVRMVQSLRQFGGRFSDAPIIAVTPRWGPPLARQTTQVFQELNVTYLRPQVKTNYSWFKFLNKPLALVTAENHITTEAVAWMDSDLLIVNEPEKLDLLPSEDFLGFPVEIKEMGTTGPGDLYEPIWQEFCKIVGIGIDQLPWVITAETNERIRLYFNGGIFVYRRATGFAKRYLELCLRLLDSEIGTNADGYSEGLKEMSAIGFAVVEMGLVWRSLPYSHDYVMLSSTHQTMYKESLLEEARVVHYHDSMWPHFWPVFLECVQKTHPHVGEWLSTLGPMSNQSPLQWKLLSKALGNVRSRAEATYKRKCRLV